MKKLIAALAVVVGSLALATPALAHTPNHSVACSGVRLWATAYNASQTNTWSITVNGVTTGGTFATNMDQTVPFTAYGDNTWSVSIDAPGTQYDYNKSGVKQGCSGPTTTTTTTSTTTTTTTTTIPEETTTTSTSTTTTSPPDTTSTTSTTTTPATTAVDASTTTLPAPTTTSSTTVAPSSSVVPSTTTPPTVSVGTAPVPPTAPPTPPVPTTNLPETGSNLNLALIALALLLGGTAVVRLARRG